MAVLIFGLMLDAALKDARREALDREAAAWAGLVTDIAKAADHLVDSRQSQTTPAALRLQAPDPATLIEMAAPAASGETSVIPLPGLPAWRTLPPGWRLRLLAAWLPGQPRAFGLLALDLPGRDADALPALRAHLDARGAAEALTMVLSPEAVLAGHPVSSTIGAYDLLLWTAPHAGLRTDVIRRLPRAGWPDLPMTTPIAVSPTASVCALPILPTVNPGSPRSAPPACDASLRNPRITADAVAAPTVDVGRLGLASLRSTSLASVPASPPTAPGRHRIHTLAAQALSATTSLTAPRASLGTLTSTHLDASRTPPGGSLAYALSLRRLATTTWTAPVLAVAAPILLPPSPARAPGLPPAIRSATVDRLQRHLSTLRLQASALLAPLPSGLALAPSATFSTLSTGTPK